MIIIIIIIITIIIIIIIIIIVILLLLLLLLLIIIIIIIIINLFSANTITYLEALYIQKLLFLFNEMSGGWKMGGCLPKSVPLDLRLKNRFPSNFYHKYYYLSPLLKCT